MSCLDYVAGYFTDSKPLVSRLIGSVATKARSAPADSVVVRREVAFRKLLGVAQGVMQIEPLWLPAEPLTGEHEAEGIALDTMKSLLIEAIAEAEAALAAKGGE